MTDAELPRPPQMPQHRPLLIDSDPLAGLGRFISQGLVDDATRKRARLHWLERQAAEEANVVGILVDLAERDRDVAFSTASGRKVRGRIRAIGADFVVVLEDHLGDVFVAVSRIALVRPAPGDRPADGSRVLGIEVVLAEALVELAADRPTVLVAAGHEDLRGELQSAGRDVVTVTLEGSRREVVHIPVAAIDHLVILHR